MSGASATALPRLGEDFVAVAAVLCLMHPERRPDGGKDLVAIENRATDVAGVVAALHLPDAQRTSGDCLAMAYPGVEWFALLDADGRWVRTRVPVDECGQSRGEVVAALAALSLTVVSRRTVGEIESTSAAASGRVAAGAGCGQTWADMVSVVTMARLPARRGVFAYPFATSREVRRCAYRVPASEQRSDKPAGTFEFGGILRPDSRKSIEAALAHLPPERACATPAGRFAVLQAGDSRGGEVYVEMDGCRRVMVTSINARVAIAQASDTLIELLAVR